MDIGKLLRATDDRAVPDKFTIYLPDRDRRNQPVRKIGAWIDTAVDIMMDINGGCTRLPPAKGGWVTEDGIFIVEDTTIIYSYLLKPESFRLQFHQIVEFLHEFGVETDQDSVMAEFSGFDGKSYITESYTIPKKNYLTSFSD